MKSFKILVVLLFIASAGWAQKEVVTVEMHVDGVCKMCKVRIENALDVNGIKAAEWDVATRTATISYRKDKISEERISELLNAAGHDTETSKASDEQYAKVHKCCKYRDMSTH